MWNLIFTVCLEIFRALVCYVCSTKGSGGGGGGGTEAQDFTVSAEKVVEC